VWNPGDPASGLASLPDPLVNLRGTTVIDGCRESDSPIGSMKPSKNGTSAPDLAERVESRGLAKRNSVAYHRGWTQGQETLSQVHDWVQQAQSACAFDPGQEPCAVVSYAGLCVRGAW
jgi:hypothetical protein